MGVSDELAASADMRQLGFPERKRPPVATGQARPRVVRTCAPPLYRGGAPRFRPRGRIS